MIDRTFARGLFLAAVALNFGLNSFRYGLGSFNRAGPGLFPLMISGLLLVIALITMVRSFLEKTREPLEFSVRNIGLLIVALCVFALVTHFINMTLGIIAMVQVASLASRDRSFKRSLIVSICLVGVAFAFKQFLGLNLPLL